MRDITTIGVDIAKNYIQIHGQSANGKPLLKKRLPRDKFLPTMANLPKCLVGIEACGGAHHWGRELSRQGHDVKLMSPRRVKKYVDNNKNDAKDAAACAEAVSRQNMLFVPIRTQVQMDIQVIHRVRSFYVKQKTALMNMIRAILFEMGIVIPKGESALIKKLVILLASENSQLDNITKDMLRQLRHTLSLTSDEIDRYKARLVELAESDEYCKRISTVPGIGPITATAVVAKIGNGSEFKNGRELSAYLGLVPKQFSSGEKILLGRISKHGDRYIRQLLIHGGRSSVYAAMRKNKLTGEYEKHDVHSIWLRVLVERVGMNKASVAAANKNARMMVALLKNDTEYKPAMAH